MMNKSKPNYKLQRIYNDGNISSPQLYRIDDYNPCRTFGRREFLKTTSIPFGGLLINGCGSSGSGEGEGIGGSGNSLSETDEEFYSKLISHMGVSKASFSPDGSTIVSIGGRRLRLWGNDNLQIRNFNAYQTPGGVGSGFDIDELIDFDFIPNSSVLIVATRTNIHYLVLGGSDIFLRQLIASSHSAFSTSISTEPVIFTGLKVTPAKQIIVFTENHGMHYWEYPSNTYMGSFHSDKLGDFFNLPKVLSVRPQGDTLIAGNRGGSVHLLEFPSSTHIATFTVAMAILNKRAIDFSPDGNTIAYVQIYFSGQSSLVIWDYTTQRDRFRFNYSLLDGEIKVFKSLVFAPDGSLICQVDRNAADGSTYPSAIIVDVINGDASNTEGLMGIDELSNDGTRYINAGYDSLDKNNNECPDKNTQITVGNVDLVSIEPTIMDGAILFSQAVTTTVSGPFYYHSMVDSRGNEVFIPSRVSSSLSSDAVCSCNSVYAGIYDCSKFNNPGSGPGGPGGGGGGGTICTCNTVCTCVPVFF